MIICLECNKKNILGSHYCSCCGFRLDGKLSSQARNKYNELITEGYHYLKQERNDEAFLLAQVCLKADPFCKHGWSLLGDYHQKRGNLSEALVSYQKAAERDPDSHLEQLKIQYFQEKFMFSNTIKKRKLNKKTAFSLAVLGGVSSAILGLILVMGNMTRTKTNSIKLNSAESSHIETFQNSPENSIMSNDEAQTVYHSTPLSSSLDPLNHNIPSANDKAPSINSTLEQNQKNHPIIAEKTPYNHAMIQDQEPTAESLPIQPLPANMRLVSIEGQKQVYKPSSSLELEQNEKSIQVEDKAPDPIQEEAKDESIVQVSLSKDEF